MAKEKTKFNMKRYDNLGLVGKLSEEDQIYAFGAMDNFGDNLTEDDLRNGYRHQLRLNDMTSSGLENAVKVYSPEYKKHRNGTTLREFCDIYSVSDYIRDSVKDYYDETIGDIESNMENWKYLLKDPKKNFTKEQKEEAKKKIEEYQQVIVKLKLVEDKRFAQLKVDAIDKTEKIIDEEEAEKKK